METNVYNIVWADDEIDFLLDDDTISDLESEGFNVVGRAHNGIELEKLLKKLSELVDAVIVDANFNESNENPGSERDTSGLDYSRGLYLRTDRKIPFFLFTNRSDELLKNVYQHNPRFLEEFPRYKRWFNKSGEGEYKALLEAIKETVDKSKTPSFIVQNRYKNELTAANLIDDTADFLLDFLINDYNNTLQEIEEPFIRVRRTIEKIFAACEDQKLIPPISNNITNTTKYFRNNRYGYKTPDGEYITQYSMSASEGDIMPKPLARSLMYIVDIVQDAAHDKDSLKLKVNEYYNNTKDTLMLRAVVYILMDVLKWFASTKENYKDPEWNSENLWREGPDPEEPITIN